MGSIKPNKNRSFFWHLSIHDDDTRSRSIFQCGVSGHRSVRRSRLRSGNDGRRRHPTRARRCRRIRPQSRQEEEQQHQLLLQQRRIPSSRPARSSQRSRRCRRCQKRERRAAGLRALQRRRRRWIRSAMRAVVDRDLAQCATSAAESAAALSLMAQLNARTATRLSARSTH